MPGQSITGELVADMIMGHDLDPRLTKFSPSRKMAGT